MATKKQTETGGNPYAVKKRYLSDAECKASAERISAEMKQDREGREKWGDQWAAYVPIGEGIFTRGKKPSNLIWPGELDKARPVIDFNS